MVTYVLLVMGKIYLKATYMIKETGGKHGKYIFNLVKLLV